MDTYFLLWMFFDYDDDDDDGYDDRELRAMTWWWLIFCYLTDCCRPTNVDFVVLVMRWLVMMKVLMAWWWDSSCLRRSLSLSFPIVPIHFLWSSQWSVKRCEVRNDWLMLSLLRFVMKAVTRHACVWMKTYNIMKTMHDSKLLLISR